MNETTHIQYKTTLGELKSYNLSIEKQLHTRCRDQVQIFASMSNYAENENFDEFYSNFAKLADNSEYMRKIMVDQNELTQKKFLLAEEITKSLETKSINMRVICYRDWINDLIEELKLKLNNENGIGGSDAWNQINHTLSKLIKHNKTNLKKYEREGIQRLEGILKEVDITMKEFETLMSWKYKWNEQVHKGSQTRDDANSQLESFPEDIQGPLRKVLNALEFWETQ